MDEERHELKERAGKGMTRRELLSGAGKLSAVGGIALVAGGGIGLLAGCGGSGGTTTSGSQGGTLPYPYVKLTSADIKTISETAHENWFTGFCAYATLSSIVSVLRDKVGAPYTSFPVEAITYAHGGTAGWGGTCGTLVGAGLAASLAAGPKAGELIINEVMQWYSTTALPIYMPDQPKATITTTSISGSPLCHLSVNKWMAKEGVGFLSAQQMERCARLSGDVATKTVEYLNSNLDGTFGVVVKSPVATNGTPSQNNCTDCHGTNVPKVPTPGGGESLIQSH